LRCTECNAMYLLDEYIQEMDKESLEQIAVRPCDRV
jgi:hypothetical protein